MSSEPEFFPAALDDYGPPTLTDDTGAQVGAHECQNGDGTRARYVLVDLEDNSTDLLCGACMLGMWSAVLAQLAASVEGQVSDSQGGVA